MLLWHNFIGKIPYRNAELKDWEQKQIIRLDYCSDITEIFPSHGFSQRNIMFMQQIFGCM